MRGNTHPKRTYTSHKTFSCTTKLYSMYFWYRYSVVCISKSSCKNRIKVLESREKMGSCFARSQEFLFSVLSSQAASSFVRRPPTYSIATTPAAMEMSLPKEVLLNFKGNQIKSFSNSFELTSSMSHKF